MIELGFADFDISGAMGVFAPAGTPREAIDRLSVEFMRAALLPDVKGGMARDGFVVAPTGPAEYNAFIRAKTEQIRSIAKAAKIKPD